MTGAHHCDESCVCPIHGTALWWWPAGRKHACQEVDCRYGHGLEGVGRPNAETTVEDELALALGAMLVVGMSPNQIAHVLIRTGWRNPTLPYLDEIPATRD